VKIVRVFTHSKLIERVIRVRVGKGTKCRLNDISERIKTCLKFKKNVYWKRKRAWEKKKNMKMGKNMQKDRR
jgi:hypothetical protein